MKKYELHHAAAAIVCHTAFKKGDTLTERVENGAERIVEQAGRFLAEYELTAKSHEHGFRCFPWRVCRQLDTLIRDVRRARYLATKALEDLPNGNIPSVWYFLDWVVGFQTEIYCDPALTATTMELLDAYSPPHRSQFTPPISSTR